MTKEVEIEITIFLKYIDIIVGDLKIQIKHKREAKTQTHVQILIDRWNWAKNYRT